METPASGGAPTDRTAGAVRPGAAIAREARAAEADFHRSASGAQGGRTGGQGPRRAAALQAFFVANAGRGLMPAGETSGAVSPSLKREET